MIFEVTDPNTGAVLELEGDSAPTEQELIDIFNTVSPQQEQQPRTNLLTDPIDTLKRSGGEFLGGLKEAVSHPIQTGKALGGLALGVGQKLIPGEQKHEAQANAIGEFYKQRYGSVEAAKTTALEDPVGFLSDLSIFITGGGAAVAKTGKIAKISKLAKAGQAIGKVGAAVDPLGAVVKGAGTAIKAGTKGRTVGLGAKLADKATIAAAKELGIDLPASAQTASKVAPLAEAFVAKGLFGDKIVRKITAAHLKLANEADDIVKAVGATDDLASAGKAIFKGADDFRDNFFRTKNVLYERAMEGNRGAKIIVKPSESLAFLDEILASKEAATKVLGKAEDINFFKTIQKNLGRGSIKGNEYRSAIQELNSKIKVISDPIATGNKAKLSKLATLMADELDEAIKVQNPNFGGALDEANKFFKEGIDQLNSSFGKKIFALKDQPDKILPAILNNRTSINDIPKIYKLIGKDNIPAVQGAFLEEYLLNQRIQQETLQLQAFQDKLLSLIQIRCRQY